MNACDVPEAKDDAKGSSPNALYDPDHVRLGILSAGRA